MNTLTLARLSEITGSPIEDRDGQYGKYQVVALTPDISATVAGNGNVKFYAPNIRVNGVKMDCDAPGAMKVISRTVATVRAKLASRGYNFDEPSLGKSSFWMNQSRVAQTATAKAQTADEFFAPEQAEPTVHHANAADDDIPF